MASIQSGSTFYCNRQVMRVGRARTCFLIIGAAAPSMPCAIALADVRPFVSQNYFTDLTIGSGGALIAGPGDQYIVSNDYSSASTQTAEWNTQNALLDFTGGGTHSVNVTSPSSSTFAWGTMQVDNANTAYLSGNGLVATTTSNSGSIQQISGSSSLGSVLGSGSLMVGGAGLAAQATVRSFSQATVTAANLGTLSVTSAVPAPTNLATVLSITGSGKLDLANSSLITSTSPSTIRQYLVNGFNNQAWNGTGGITSVNAAGDFASNGAYATRALGFASGTGAVGMGLGLSPNQTLVKFTIYGDADLSGGVDISDLNIVLNNFLGGNTWDTGDMYYSGSTDISDLNAVLNNFFASAPVTTRPLSLAKAHAAAASVSTAHTLTGTASPAANPPTPAFNTLELVVNTSTGDVQIIGNNTQTGDTQITSSSNGIITAQWHDLKSQGFSNWQDTAKKAFGIGEFDTQFAATGDFALINDVDYGNIYNTTANAEDYIFKYGAVDQTTGLLDTLTGSVFYVSGVPEPTTLSLIGISAAGLLARRRRRAAKDPLNAPHYMA